MRRLIAATVLASSSALAAPHYLGIRDGAYAYIGETREPLVNGLRGPTVAIFIRYLGIQDGRRTIEWTDGRGQIVRDACTSPCQTIRETITLNGKLVSENVKALAPDTGIAEALQDAIAGDLMQQLHPLPPLAHYLGRVGELYAYTGETDLPDVDGLPVPLAVFFIRYLGKDGGQPTIEWASGSGQVVRQSCADAPCRAIHATVSAGGKVQFEGEDAIVLRGASSDALNDALAGRLEGPHIDPLARIGSLIAKSVGPDSAGQYHHYYVVARQSGVIGISVDLDYRTPVPNAQIDCAKHAYTQGYGSQTWIEIPPESIVGEIEKSVCRP